MGTPLEHAEMHCRKIGRQLGDQMPSGWGFALLLFSFNEPTETTYISNCERESMVKALRELCDKLERGDPEL